MDDVAAGQFTTLTTLGELFPQDIHGWLRWLRLAFFQDFYKDEDEAMAESRELFRAVRRDGATEEAPMAKLFRWSIPRLAKGDAAGTTKWWGWDFELPYPQALAVFDFMAATLSNLCPESPPFCRFRYH